MEEEMKNTGAFNENAEEMPQQETINENTAPDNAGEQPKKRRSFRWLFILLAIAIVGAAAGVTAMRIVKSKKHQDEYAYEYGYEPSDGPVSYNKGKSNIVNPVTKEVIVKDIDWCHYSSSND